jgi:hypothetical protein
MAGDLWIAGGGSTAVATSGLFDDAQRLDGVSDILSDCLGRIARIDRLVMSARLRVIPSASSASAAERAIDDATAALARAAPFAHSLRVALIASAHAYGIGEGVAERLAQHAAARFGALLGMALPALVIGALPGILGVGGAAAIGLLLLPEEQRSELLAALPGWLREHSAALSDPRVVELVRLGVMSADDFGGGVLQLPPGAVSALGDEGLGILGLTASSGVLMRLARPTGALAETAVSIRRLGEAAPSTRALSYADRAGRIPQETAQVRIDRYSRAGQPDRFEVYVGGTRDFSLTPGNDPWDMTSNVNAMAGGAAGSSRAVSLAMADAGIGPSSPVIFTGYSQGGLIAAELVASGEYDARGLYTLGAPAAQVAVPPSVPWVAIEHTDDLVPAVGGTWATADPVLVRRELFDGRPPATDVILPAHQLEAYRGTAALVDRSPEGRVVSVLEDFDRFGDGVTSVQSTLYYGTRISAPGAVPGG